MVVYILNFLLYLYLLVKSLFYRKVTTVFFVYFIYTIISFFSILIYDTEYYAWGDARIYGSFVRNELSVIPLIYIYVCFIILINPLKRVCRINFTNISRISSIVENILFVLFVTITLLILILYKDQVLNTSLLDAYVDSKESGAYGFKGVIRIIEEGLRPLNITFSFYLITNKVKQYKKGIILIILLFISALFQAMIAGSRGSIVINFMLWCFTFLIFRDLIEKNIKKYIYMFCIISVSLITVLILSISVLRFGEFQAIYWIASYLGEVFLNFPLVYWDSPITYNGAITMGNFMSVSYDANKTDDPIYLFKSFGGGLYLDFGLIGGILVAIIIALIIKKLLSNIKGSLVNLESLMLYVFSGSILVKSVFDFALSGWSAYAMLFLSYLLLKSSRCKNRTISHIDNNEDKV